MQFPGVEKALAPGDAENVDCKFDKPELPSFSPLLQMTPGQVVVKQTRIIWNYEGMSWEKHRLVSRSCEWQFYTDRNTCILVTVSNLRVACCGTEEDTSCEAMNKEKPRV